MCRLVITYRRSSNMIVQCCVALSRGTRLWRYRSFHWFCLKGKQESVHMCRRGCDSAILLELGVKEARCKWCNGKVRIDLLRPFGQNLLKCTFTQPLWLPASTLDACWCQHNWFQHKGPRVVSLIALVLYLLCSKTVGKKKWLWRPMPKLALLSPKGEISIL